MSAAVWHGAAELEVTSVPLPAQPPGWTLLRVERVGICGTDLAIRSGQHPRATPPLIMGHEIVGTVVAAAASGPAEGTRVVVEPLITCGQCRACRSGNGHVCRYLKLFGIDAPGGLAEYVAIPAERLHEVPASVPPNIAVLIEPLAVAVHAVRLGGAAPRAQDAVAVLGGGPIGLLTALVARHRGAQTVVVAEPDPSRRTIASKLGFTVAAEAAEVAEVIAPFTNGEGADVTFDAVGHPAAALEATRCTRALGTIVVVGVYKRPAAVDLQTIAFQEQSMIGARVYSRDDMRHAVELVIEGCLALEELPVRVFPLSEVSAAFAAAERGDVGVKGLVAVES